MITVFRIRVYVICGNALNRLFADGGIGRCMVGSDSKQARNTLKEFLQRRRKRDFLSQRADDGTTRNVTADICVKRMKTGDRKHTSR